MATQVTSFTPSSQAAFAFQPTLDQQSYNAVVPTNLFGQRFYLSLTKPNGAPLVNLPLVGSPIGITIQALTWAHGIVTATTQVPHGYRIGSRINLTMTGCVPAVFNGSIQMLVTGPQTLTWLIPTDPGLATVLGVVSYDINLVGGYFTSSKLVYRIPSQNFEVT